MKKLTPDERAARDAVREDAKKASNRARWTTKMEEVTPLMAEAAAKVKAALGDKDLSLRDLWLVLGVFETEEKIALAGGHESCKTKWFDRIAPRANPDVYPYYGVSSYSVKTAAKASAFLKGSRNGYVYLTDLGYAAARWMRETFSTLNPAYGSPPHKKPMPMDTLGDMPFPRWREWKDWDV